MELNLFTNSRGFESLATIISLDICSIFLIAMGGGKHLERAENRKDLSWLAVAVHYSKRSILEDGDSIYIHRAEREFWC